jgi:membrane protease YdiL (CAAX protease family)
MQSNQSPVLIPEYSVEKKPSVPWGFWPTVGFGLLIAIAYVAAQTLIEVIFAIKTVISNPGISSSQLINNLSNGNILAITIIISALIGIGFTILFAKIRKGISLKEYLALRPIKITTVFIMFGVVIALLIISAVATSGLSQSKFTNQMVQAYQSSTMPAFIWIAVVFFAPVFEEIFFRGFLFAGFRNSRVGIIGAILLTAVLWALLHATQYGIWELLVIFGLGVAFGVVRWRTNSLFASLSMHSMWNLIAMVQTLLYIQGRIH